MLPCKQSGAREPLQLKTEYDNGYQGKPKPRNRRQEDRNRRSHIVHGRVLMRRRINTDRYTQYQCQQRTVNPQFESDPDAAADICHHRSVGCIGIAQIKAGHNIYNIVDQPFQNRFIKSQLSFFCVILLLCVVAWQVIYDRVAGHKVRQNECNDDHPQQNRNDHK